MTSQQGPRLDKSKLSEADICEKFISPALTAAGWDVHEQILREYPLRPGRMVVRGQKASRDRKSVLRADYVLFWKANIPLAEYRRLQAEAQSIRDQLKALLGTALAGK
jgi:type I site-specific restriction endonuclease